MDRDLKLSVIVPVFNERLTLRKLIGRVRAVPIRKQIVIVDDASTDGTADVIRDLEASWGNDPMNEVHVIWQEQNAGKGAAVRAAVPHVTGDVTLIQDADLEYDPNEYPTLLQPILDGDADVVYGSRFLAGPRRVLFFRHMIGNKFLTFLSNFCTDLNLTDMETCYKVFRTDLLRRLHLVSNRFGIEPEITAKVARLGCRIYEVPISYRGREYWEGKKIGWRDGFAAIFTIIKYALIDDRENRDAGYKTLQRMRRLRRYNEWVWSLLAPHVGDRILEVGCGVGTFTRFMQGSEHILATDNNEHYIDLVRRSFEHTDTVEVRKIDWGRPDLEELAGHRLDTVVCLNVLEHIEDDDEALATFANLLRPNGRVVLQVPAMRRIYGEIDASIGHYRRYEREELAAKLRASGFQVESIFYFNTPGMLGWYFNAQILKRKTVPGFQAWTMNLLLPWLRLEQKFNPSFGMSLIAVGRKPPAVQATDEGRIPRLAVHH
jgi:glycosyltransferase involved in cell wall biosynthesis